MAQSILLKRSSVAGNVPDSSDLSLGEVAINTADGAVYIKKGNNDIVAVHDNDILHIDTTNSRIGIGTTSPGYKLHINSGISDWPALFKSTDAKAGIVIQDSNTVNYVVSKSYTLSLGNQADLHANNLNVKSTGKVGIGTTSPSKRLHVVDSASHQLQLQGSNSYWNVGTGWSGYYQDYFLVANNSGEKLVIDTNGNVGIGTNSPASLLSLQGDGTVFRMDGTANTSRTMLFRNVGTGEGIVQTDGNMHFLQEDANRYIRFSTSNTERIRITSSGNLQFTGKTTNFESPGFTYHTNNYLYLRGGSAGLILADDSNANTIQIIDGSSGYINFETGDGTSRMRILSSGDVGIGTTSPTRELEVYRTGASVIAIKSNTGGLSQLALGDTDDDNYAQILLDNSTNKLQIQNGGGGTVGNRGITLDSSENVGIGTSSPAAPLHVTKSSNDVTLLHLSHSSANSGTADYAHYGEILLQGSTHCKSGIRAYSNGYQTANSALSFFTSQHGGSYAERMRIMGDGKVGIGTTSPNSVLHVSHATAPTFRLSRTGTGQVWVQSIDSSGRFHLAEAASEGGTQHTRLQVDDTGEITFNGAYTFPTSDGSANQVLKTDGSGNLTFATVAGASGGTSISDADGDTKIQVEESSDEDIIRFDTAGTERMTISSSGVQASTYFSTTNTSNGLLIGSNKARFKVNGDNTVIDAIPGSGGINFRTGGAIQRMHIGSDGNVGIGTTSPNAHTNQTTLTINGTTHGRIDFETGDTLRGSVYGDSGSLNLDAGGNYIRFYTGNSERMRLDASGRLSLSGQTTNYLTHDTNYLRHTTASGYIQIGPGNTSHAHILTDRSNFYFNKQIQVDTGVITSHDEDLILRRAQTSTTGQLTLTRGKFYGGSQTATDLLNSSMVIGGFHANSAFEEAYNHFYIPGLSPNNLAGSHRRHTVTVTKNGTTISPNISEMFSANGANTSFSHAAGSTDTIVITITGIAMSYGQHVGVQFGHPTFRAKDIEIEVTTDNGANWTSIYDVTNFPYATVSHYHGGSGTATNGIRYTFTNFNNTGMRINQLFCYDYSENEIYFAEKNQDQTIRGHWTWLDNYEARFGNGGDLKIKHDGNHSYIQDVGTGSLYLDASGLLVRNPSNNANMIVATAGSTVTLYHNGSAKIATKADGVDVTGELQSDSLDVDGNADISGNLVLGGDLTVNGTTTTINAATLNVEDKNITLNYGSGDTSSSANGSGITIQDAVNSSTDATILWDTGNDRFNYSHGISLPDNKKFQVGSGSDMYIQHTGGESQIFNSTGQLDIRSSTRILLTSSAGENMARFTNDGAAELFFNNVSKFATQSYGALLQGVILGNDGSASGPTFSFSNDSDTGMYRATSNALSFSTGGVERVRINSSGNVQLVGNMVIQDTTGTRGIFRNNDAYDLRLGGGVDMSDGAFISLGGENRGGATSTARGKVEIRAGGNAFASQADILGDIVLGASWNGGTADILNLDSSTGRVGIGTNSPSSKLVVADNGGAGLEVIPQTTNDRVTLLSYDRNTSTYQTVDFDGSEIHFNIAGTEKAKVDSSGRVLIGTSTMFSDANADDLQVGNTSGAHGISIMSQNSHNGNIFFGDNDNNDAGRVSYNHTNNRMEFYTNRSQRLVIDSSGNVGIGTNSPKNQLHVSGGGYFTGFTNPNGSGVAGLEVGYDGTQSVLQSYHRGTSSYKGININASHISFRTSGTERARVDGSNFDIESGGFRVNDPGNNYPFAITQYGYMTTRGSSITQLNGTDHANVPLSVLADVASTRTANYVEIGDIGSAGNKFVIDEDGDVGIGTTSPTDKLQVNGNINIVSNKIYNGSANNSAGLELGGSRMNLHGYNGIRFYSSAAGIGSQTERMRIENNGNVSIGAPSAQNGKLHVNGNFRVGPYYSANDRDGFLMIPHGSDTRLQSNNERFHIENNQGNILITASGVVQVGEYAVDTTSTSSSATTQIAIHSFAAATFRSARFTVQVTNSTDSTYHTTELLLVHDGTTANITEFGEIHTGSAREATFDADINSGNVRLLATPASTDTMAFKVVCHSITT